MFLTILEFFLLEQRFNISEARGTV